MTYILRLTLILTLFFVGIALAIQLQANNLAEIQTFFAPSDNCPTACFMGIRPGITTAAEAGIILEEHPWVKSFEVMFDTDSREGQLIWKWSGAQPSQIRTEQDGVLRICDSIICGLSIATRIPYGAILLALGEPTSGTVRSLPDKQQMKVIYTAWYDQLQLDIRSRSYCPPQFTAMAMHQQVITFHIGIVREQISRSSLQRARLQPIFFQGQSLAWLLRRGFVCPP